MIRPRVPRWIILAILLLIAMGRSAVFVIAPESYFDADQAVFGLMAKHLAELRAFPLFMYGQSYILGVDAWMAAPLFALFGTADYWLAYYIDFMTNERILIAATEPQRIKSYNAVVAAHAAAAVRLSRKRCDEGILLIPGVYQCR